MSMVLLSVMLMTIISLIVEGLCSVYPADWCDGSNDRTHSKEFFGFSGKAGLLNGCKIDVYSLIILLFCDFCWLLIFFFF